MSVVCDTKYKLVASLGIFLCLFPPVTWGEECPEGFYPNGDGDYCCVPWQTGFKCSVEIEPLGLPNTDPPIISSLNESAAVLTWPAIVGVPCGMERYYVYTIEQHVQPGTWTRWPSPTSYLPVASDAASDLRLALTPLSYDQNYYFRVKSLRQYPGAIGEATSVTNYVQFKTPCKAPDALTNVEVVRQQSQNKINLVISYQVPQADDCRGIVSVVAEYRSASATKWRRINLESANVANDLEPDNYVIRLTAFTAQDLSSSVKIKSFYNTDCGNCADHNCAKKTPCQHCKAGFQSVECRTACDGGRYGVNCEETCSSGCKYTCNVTDGHCVCKQGFEGLKCTTPIRSDTEDDDEEEEEEDENEDEDGGRNSNVWLAVGLVILCLFIAGLVGLGVGAFILYRKRQVKRGSHTSKFVDSRNNLKIHMTKQVPPSLSVINQCPKKKLKPPVPTIPREDSGYLQPVKNSEQGMGIGKPAQAAAPIINKSPQKNPRPKAKDPVPTKSQRDYGYIYPAAGFEQGTALGKPVQTVAPIINKGPQKKLKAKDPVPTESQRDSGYIYPVASFEPGMVKPTPAPKPITKEAQRSKQTANNQYLPLTVYENADGANAYEELDPHTQYG